MKKNIKKVAKRVKRLVSEVGTWDLIASGACSCKDNCNKVFIMAQPKDKETIELAIDWELSTEKPKPEDKTVSVLVSRQWITDNLLRSGEPPTKLAEFEYALDIYFAEMQKEKGVKNAKMPDEVGVQSLKDWVRKKVNEEYARK